MPDNILKVKNLNKKFYSKNGVVNAIDNVSFELKTGKVLGLVGESGSGKTTIGRTIMNLHESDSGVIEIDGKKYSGKLKKAQKKELYRNVQMIFQDPYSSLNGQKNIKAILEESLLVKGMKEELLMDYLDDRSEVYKYFGMSFSEFFWKGYWEYRNYANKTALDYYTKIEKSVSEVKINPKNDIMDEWNKVDQAVFENKKEANTLILLKLNDFLGSLFSKWQELQVKVTKGNFEDADEKALFTAKSSLEKIEKELLHSNNYYSFIEKKANINKELSTLKTNIEVLKLNFKRDLKTKRKDLKKILASDKLDVNYSQTIAGYESQKIGFYLDKILLELIKNKEISKTDTYLDFDDLYIGIERKIYLDNAKFYKMAKEGVKFSEEDVKKANPIEPFISLIVQKADAATKKDINAIAKLEKQLAEINLKLEVVTKEDAKRDLSVLTTKKEAAVVALTKAQEFNDSEIKIYRDKMDAKAKDIIAKNKIKAKEDNEKLDEYRKVVKEKITSLMKEVYEINNFNELEFANKKSAIVNIKAKLKTNIKQNAEFEIEIKRVFKNISIAKTLFNINSHEIKKINFYNKNKIIKLLTLMKIFETLEEVGLNKGHVYGYPHEFSGGMRQRVGIARAIISNPKIIIADEPIAALDLSIQAQIVNLLSDLKRKRDLSVIFIAHDLAMVEFNSDDVLIMHLGKLVETGEANKIFKKPVHPYTKNLINSMPSLEAINKGFKENNFKPVYLNKYSVTNVPSFHEVTKDHWVLADEEQIKIWTKRK